MKDREAKQYIQMGGDKSLKEANKQAAKSGKCSYGKAAASSRAPRVQETSMSAMWERRSPEKILPTETARRGRQAPKKSVPAFVNTETPESSALIPTFALKVSILEQEVPPANSV
jgi:hypothetical protein